MQPVQDAARERALNLLEIRTLIGHFLDRDSLAKCALVHSTWEATFNSLLWQSFKVTDKSPHVPWSGFERNKDWIGEIDLYTFSQNLPAESLKLRDCARLTTLSITAYVLTEEQVDLLGGLLAGSHAKTLKVVRLVYGCQGVQTEVWEALAKCTGLKQLVLWRMEIKEEEAGAFWRACLASGESLELKDMILPEGLRSIQRKAENDGLGPGQEEVNANVGGLWATPSRARRIYWDQNICRVNGPEHAVECLKWFPHLESMALHSLAIDSSAFSRAATSGSWKKLCSITLHATALQPEDLGLALESIQPLENLCIRHQSGVMMMTPFVFGALIRHHFRGIRRIQLFPRVPGVTSTHVQTILESCPALEVFCGPTLTMFEIRTGKPWVCLNLKELTLDIILGAGNPPREGIDEWATWAGDFVGGKTGQQVEQHMIFDRLGCLTRLERLTLVEEQIRAEDLFLRMSLEMGLDALKGLKALKSLEMVGEQTIGEDEVRWMVEHWPKLKWVKVRSRGHFDRVSHRKVVEMFRQHGIQC